MKLQQENLLNSSLEHTQIGGSLRIMGDDFNCDEITDALGILPTNIWKKGEQIRNSSRKYSYSAWIYDIKKINTLYLCDISEKILYLFNNKIGAIKQLIDVYGLEISIDFVIIIENKEAPAIVFTPDFVNFASKLGARLDIDTYVN